MGIEVGIIDDTSRPFLNVPDVVNHTYLLDDAIEIYGNEVCNINRNSTSYQDPNNFICDHDFDYDIFIASLIR